MDMPQIQANSRPAHFMFAAWAVSQAEVPSTRQIMDETGLSINSARQWRSDWIAVRAWLATGEWSAS